MNRFYALLLLAITSCCTTVNYAGACDVFKTCLAVADCVTNPKWNAEMMRVKGSGQGIADDTALCQHQDNPGNTNFNGDSAGCVAQNWEIIGRFAYQGKNECSKVPK
jgi:hypothetical protein